ncbi:FecR domain-containing protein [Prochlorothrix hollandica]|uniref:FecR domain-containing protein n=1 Tax=Prochlorothrix hollandica TaxID=1223 RepID=UPI0033413B86
MALLMKVFETALLQTGLSQTGLSQTVSWIAAARSRRNRSLLSPRLWGAIVGVGVVGLGTSPPPALAGQPLTQAQISYVQNQVSVLDRNRNARPAQLRDLVTPGNGVATRAKSLVELRFNDGSLARIGEQAVFWFVPNSRDLQLSNGTALMLIPPGQGRTRVRTPNVVAGIEGSGFFVRVIAETQQTLVGTLTDSGITVCPVASGACQVLAGGQLAQIDEGGLRLYDLDLETFYSTSSLVQGLNLTEVPTAEELETDPLAAVRLETTTTLELQTPLVESQVVMNPAAMRLPVAAPGAIPGVIPGVLDASIARLLFPDRASGSSFLEALDSNSTDNATSFGGRSLLEMGEFQLTELDQDAGVAAIRDRMQLEVGELQIPGLTESGGSSATAVTTTGGGVDLGDLGDLGNDNGRDQCSPGIAIAQGNNPNNPNIGKNFNCP